MAKRRLDFSELGSGDHATKASPPGDGEEVEVVVKAADEAQTAEDPERDPPIVLCTRVRRVPWDEATLLIRVHNSDLMTPPRTITADKPEDERSNERGC